MFFCNMFYCVTCTEKARDTLRRHRAWLHINLILKKAHVIYLKQKQARTKKNQTMNIHFINIKLAHYNHVTDLKLLNHTCHSVMHSPRGDTWIWKWRISAYRRQKVGGIRCKILLKEGGHSVWVPRKWVLFWCGPQKWGSFSVQMCNFKPKFAKFML